MAVVPEAIAGFLDGETPQAWIDEAARQALYRVAPLDLHPPQCAE